MCLLLLNWSMVFESYPTSYSWVGYPPCFLKLVPYTTHQNMRFYFSRYMQIAIWNSYCCSVFLQSQLKVVNISNIVFVKWNKILSMRKMAYWEKAESIRYLVLANWKHCKICLIEHIKCFLKIQTYQVQCYFGNTQTITSCSGKDYNKIFQIVMRWWRFDRPLRGEYSVRTNNGCQGNSLF